MSSHVSSCSLPPSPFLDTCGGALHTLQLLPPTLKWRKHGVVTGGDGVATPLGPEVFVCQQAVCTDAEEVERNELGSVVEVMQHGAHQRLGMRLLPRAGCQRPIEPAALMQCQTLM